MREMSPAFFPAIESLIFGKSTNPARAFGSLLLPLLCRHTSMWHCLPVNCFNLPDANN
jgi:hypothetical protein